MTKTQISFTDPSSADTVSVLLPVYRVSGEASRQLYEALFRRLSTAGSFSLAAARGVIADELGLSVGSEDYNRVSQALASQLSTMIREPDCRLVRSGPRNNGSYVWLDDDADLAAAKAAQTLQTRIGTGKTATKKTKQPNPCVVHAGARMLVLQVRDGVALIQVSCPGGDGTVYRALLEAVL